MLRIHRTWLRMAILLLVGALIVSGLTLYERFNSQPGQDGNAKIAWGSMCKGTECRPAALLYGRIPASATPVIQALSKRPEVRTLCLDSVGGNAAAARDLASWLIDHKYDTCIPQIGTPPKKLDAMCVSACTMIFVEGQRRLLSTTGLFQIHSASVPWIRRLYGDPANEGGTAAPAPTLVFRLLEPVNRFAASVSLWLATLGLPESLARDRLMEEAGKTPFYLLRTVPADRLLEWKVLTEPATNDIFFTAAKPD